MRKQSIFIVLLLNSIIGYSQQIPQSLIHKDSIPYLYAWNDSVIQTHIDKRKTYISINGQTTDSIKNKYGVFGRSISSNDKNRKDIIYDGGDYYKLSIETGKLDTILLRSENKYSNESDGVAIGNLLYGSTTMIDTIIGNFLLSYDIITKEKKVLCNIDEDDYSIGSIVDSVT
jgi:hypothetical protein